MIIPQSYYVKRGITGKIETRFNRAGLDKQDLCKKVNIQYPTDEDKAEDIRKKEYPRPN
jgi:hypothetical protein